MEEMFKKLKLLVDLANYQQAAARLFGGVIPVRIPCPNCGVDVELKVPLAMTVISNDTPTEKPPSEEKALTKEDQPTKVCSSCGAKYMPTIATNTVRPIWEAKGLCSKECWEGEKV